MVIDNKTIARAWMASPHWGGWREGMRDYLTGRVCIGVLTSGSPVWHRDERKRDGHGGGLPNLGHPGTRAFLLEDVRRAWGDEHLTPERRCDFDDMLAYEPNDEYWALRTRVLDEDGFLVDQPWHRGECGTESSALLAALQAAPEGT